LGGVVCAQRVADEAEHDQDPREAGDREQQRRDEREPADEQQDLDGVLAREDPGLALRGCVGP
jgi:hypothetical protein